MAMRWSSVIQLAVFALCGCQSSEPDRTRNARADAAVGGEAIAGGAAGVLTLEGAMRDYRGWGRRQAEAQAISSEIFSLCRLPSAAEQRFVESEHGDGLFLLDWVNELAGAGLAADGGGYGRGAAIVKEKLRGSGGDSELAALGIMIKREAGFDAARGDWQFGYWEPAAGLRSGAEAATHCGGCHAGSRTDYVFADASWRL